MYIEELDRELSSREADIWFGTAKDISEEKMEKYRRIWRERTKKNNDKPKEMEMPSIVRQIYNFGKSFTRYLIHGRPQVPDDMFNERLKICDTCEYKTDDWRCSECGCYIETKANWATEDCPKKKWPLPMVDKTTLPPKGPGCGGCNKKNV